MTASERTNSLGTYHVSEDSYRKEWATLTGRAPSDIYIPEGVRVNDMPTRDIPRKREHEDSE